ncbi:MAG: type II secretion system protein [Candidatus Omnitrophota bacterium]
MPRRKSVTLMEMLVVIIIIGVLAALALPNFGPFKEKTLEREAKASLSLVRAAEKIYRMENSFYCPDSGSSPILTSAINTNLKLSLLEGTSKNWDYKIVSTGANNFSARAKRVTDPTKVWCITDATEDPYTAACVY